MLPRRFHSLVLVTLVSAPLLLDAAGRPAGTCLGDDLVITPLQMGGQPSLDFPPLRPDEFPQPSVFSRFDVPQVTGNGHILYSAVLSDPGASAFFRDSIWTSTIADPNTSQLQVRYGDPAPTVDWNSTIAPMPLFQGSGSVSQRGARLIPRGITNTGSVVFTGGRFGIVESNPDVSVFQDDGHIVWQANGGTVTEFANFGELATVDFEYLSEIGQAAMVVDLGGPDQLFVKDMEVALQNNVPFAVGSQFADGFGADGGYRFTAAGDLYFQSDVDSPIESFQGIYRAGAGAGSSGLEVVIAEGGDYNLPDGTTATLSDLRGVTGNGYGLQVTSTGDVGFLGDGHVLLGNASGVRSVLAPSPGRNYDVFIDGLERTVQFSQVTDLLIGPDDTIYFEAEAEIRELPLLGQFKNFVWKMQEGGTPDALLVEGEVAIDLEEGMTDILYGDTFTLKDTNENGDLLLAARLDRDHPSVSSANDDTLVVFDDVGAAAILAREGSEIPLLGGAKYGAIDAARGASLSDNGDVVFLSDNRFSSDPASINAVLVATVTPVNMETLDFLWSRACGTDNWHAQCADSNWLKPDGNPAEKSPGDAAGTENVTIMNADVRIADREVDIRALDATGSLSVQQDLMVRESAAMQNLTLLAKLTAAGPVSLSGANTSSGVMELTAGALTVENDSSLTFAVNAESGVESFVTGGGSLETSSTGRMVIERATIDALQGGLTNKGTLVIGDNVNPVAGTALTLRATRLTNDGLVIQTSDIQVAPAADGDTAITNDGTFTLDGSVRILSSRAFRFENRTGAKLDKEGAGTARIGGEVVSRGSINVREGTLTLAGRTELDATAIGGNSSVLLGTPSGGAGTLELGAQGLEPTTIKGEVKIAMEGGPSSESELVINSGLRFERGASLTIGQTEPNVFTKGKVTWAGGDIVGPSRDSRANIDIKLSDPRITIGNPGTIGSLDLRDVNVVFSAPFTLSLGHRVDQVSDLKLVRSKLMSRNVDHVLDLPGVDVLSEGPSEFVLDGTGTLAVSTGGEHVIEPEFKIGHSNAGVTADDRSILRIINPSSDVLSGNVLKTGTYQVLSDSRIFLGPMGANPEILEIGAQATVILEGEGSRDDDVTGRLNNLPTVAGGFKNGGRLELKTIRFSVEGRLDNAKSGRIRLIDARILPSDGYTNRGFISGTGLVGADFLNHGTIGPGSSPGTITVDGNFTQSAEGMTILEIGGTIPDEQYDQLVVTGDAQIGGTVVLQFIDGFAPTAGQEFGSLLGVGGAADVADATFLVQNLASGFEFDVTPMASGFMLTALNDGTFRQAVEGDYNNSGLVEQGDLDLVLLNWGADAAPVPAGWINHLPLGTIDQNELDAVLLHWGDQGAATAAASVPEPSSLLLVAAGGLLLLLAARPLWRKAQRGPSRHPKPGTAHRGYNRSGSRVRSSFFAEREYALVN